MANNKNTGGINPNVVLLVGGAALIYVGALNPILKWLGIKDDKDDKKEGKENAKAENAVGWNPSFWLTYRPAGVTICLMTDAKATRLAKQIKDAWGVFNDDENAIYAAIREVRSQVQLSQLAAKYSSQYKTDLWTRLANPWNKLDDGLEPAELAIVSKIVNALPVNVTNCG